MSTLIQQIRSDFTANVDEHTRDTAKRFFKEEIKIYGIKTALVGKIAKKYWRQIQH